MRADKPVAIDLYCGLGGWSDGLLAEGWTVVGFDIEQHDYGTGGYPGQLVIQDVLTLHGSQFKTASLIVASPPCQAYSYRAIPWKRAKALPPPDNSLFDACFRIQREANAENGCIRDGDCAECDGTGNFYGHDEDGDFLPCDECDGTGVKRYIPLIVENVRGAIKWVSHPVKWHFGSYYLWGDVPALMPLRLLNSPDGRKMPPEINESIRNGKSPTRWTNPAEYGVKLGGCNGRRFDERPKGNVAAHREGTKVPGNKLSDNGFTIPVARTIDQSLKPETFALNAEDKRQHLSFSRKAASAMIAKIPFPLAQHVAQVFKPEACQ